MVVSFVKKLPESSSYSVSEDWNNGKMENWNDGILENWEKILPGL